MADESLPPAYDDAVGAQGQQENGPEDEQQPPPPLGDDAPAAPTNSEHINIKVTDGNNEVFFKIKRTTQLKKLMDVFCDRQGKDPRTVRFLFDGDRVQPTDDPNGLDMEDGDALEVHQEQLGGSA